MKLRMKLYPAQLKAWNSDKKIVAFIGGIGCGKTYLGIRWYERRASGTNIFVSKQYHVFRRFLLCRGLP